MSRARKIIESMADISAALARKAAHGEIAGKRTILRADPLAGGALYGTHAGLKTARLLQRAHIEKETREQKTAQVGMGPELRDAQQKLSQARKAMWKNPFNSAHRDEVRQHKERVEQIQDRGLQTHLDRLVAAPKHAQRDILYGHQTAL